MIVKNKFIYLFVSLILFNTGTSNANTKTLNIQTQHENSGSNSNKLEDAHMIADYLGDFLMAIGIGCAFYGSRNMGIEDNKAWEKLKRSDVRYLYIGRIAGVIGLGIKCISFPLSILKNLK